MLGLVSTVMDNTFVQIVSDYGFVAV